MLQTHVLALFGQTGRPVHRASRASELAAASSPCFGDWPDAPMKFFSHPDGSEKGKTLVSLSFLLFLSVFQDSDNYEFLEGLEGPALKSFC